MNSNRFVTVCNLKEMATFELGKGNEEYRNEWC